MIPSSSDPPRTSPCKCINLISHAYIIVSMYIYIKSCKFRPVVVFRQTHTAWPERVVVATFLELPQQQDRLRVKRTPLIAGVVHVNTFLKRDQCKQPRSVILRLLVSSAPCCSSLVDWLSHWLVLMRRVWFLVLPVSWLWSKVLLICFNFCVVVHHSCWASSENCELTTLIFQCSSSYETIN